MDSDTCKELKETMKDVITRWVQRCDNGDDMSESDIELYEKALETLDVIKPF